MPCRAADFASSIRRRGKRSIATMRALRCNWRRMRWRYGQPTAGRRSSDLTAGRTAGSRAASGSRSSTRSDTRSMQWSSDRTGFPVLELPGQRLAVHLLPVVKQQFERFLADPGPFGDAWYEELLTVSPRIPLGETSPDLYEMLFLSGIQPGEIPPFAKWLGQGFEIPTADVWRGIDRALAAEPVQEVDAQSLRNDPNLAPAARRILGWVIDHRKPQTWDELLLLR